MGQAGKAGSSTEVDSQVQALEAAVADVHRQAQLLYKVPGREGEATKHYKQMAELDDQALNLRLAHPNFATAAAIAAHPAAPPPLAAAPSWRDMAAACRLGGLGREACSGTALRQRALGAVLGFTLGDAAACGVMWCYELTKLAGLAAGESRHYCLCWLLPRHWQPPSFLFLFPSSFGTK